MGLGYNRNEIAYRECESTAILDEQLLDKFEVLLLGPLAVPTLEAICDLDDIASIANPLVPQMGSTASDLTSVSNY